MDFHVREISAIETRKIRHRVLWPHRDRWEDCTIDVDEADHACHLGAFDSNDQLVGVCSLFDQRSERFPHAIPNEEKVYRLRVMATVPEVRGLGAGAQIVTFAGHWCRKKDAAWLWCDAREIAFGFYERVGFSFVSDEYEIVPIGRHRMMALKL